MSFPQLKLQRRQREAGGEVKTRVFSVRRLAYLAASSLWEPEGAAGAVRPVWLGYLASDQESRAFTANFRAGRLAATGTIKFQVPRRSPHRWVTQRSGDLVITVAFLPELFHLDPPGPFCSDVCFVFAPPRWWLEAQAERLAAEFGEDAWEAARAALFAAFLDRRTALPLVSDLRFHLRLYRAALEADWLHRAEDSDYGNGLLQGTGWSACGLDEPLACRVGTAAFHQFLIEQTTLYRREEISHGTTRLAADRRLLSYPDAPAEQLRFDFAVA